MTTQLCISATFLDPLFHGQDDDGPEWPPSPMRLFQAMLAGSRGGCRDSRWSEAKAEAFRWLESRQPPIILAPSAQPGSGHVLFVPNNDGDKRERQNRLTSKSVLPHHLLDGDTVHYLWPIEEAVATNHAEVLGQEARSLIALGWGIDQVAGNGRILTDAEARALTGNRWCAWTGVPSGMRSSRVPVEGSLMDLEKVHRSFLSQWSDGPRRPPQQLSRFDRVVYRRENSLPPRPRAAFELPENVAFRQEDVVRVSAMLRSLTCRLAVADSHQFPGGSETYVAGHTGNQKRSVARFSYLPLPTIGHPYADGLIRRLIIAEPYGGEGTHARWARERLGSAELLNRDGHSRGILMEPWRNTSENLINRYTAGSRWWSSVTPVFLPGFDDDKQPKAEKLFLTAARQAGLPLDSLTELTLRKAPFWPGSQHPSQYFLPKYLNGKPGWHVRLVFREPVAGPLAVGAGRHVGLGLFARNDA